MSKSNTEVVSETIRRVTASGIVYEGTFKSGKLINGLKICNNNQVYEGKFYSNGFLKQGTYSKEGRIVFKGLFYENGKFHEGLLYTNQYSYDGFWNTDGVFYKGKRASMSERDPIKYEEGDWVNMKLINGRRVYRNNEVEEGEFNGKLIKGKKTSVNNPDLEGEFTNGLLTSGTTTLKNGIKLVGEFSNGSLVSGVIIMSNNAEYIIDNIANSGKNYYMNGSFNTKGELVNGFIVHLVDGLVYEGEFSNNCLVEGKLTNQDGSYSEGLFNGIRPSKLMKGVQYYPNLYHKEGVYDSSGDLKKGTFHDLSSDIKYIGDFKKSKLVKGTIEYPDGMRYRGDCRKGIPHGVGCMFGPDNNRNGEWVNGKFNTGILSIRKEDGSYINITYKCSEVAPPSYHAMEDKMRVAIEQVGRMEEQINHLTKMNKMLMMLMAHQGIEMPEDEEGGLD
jgi:hypothetical protein